MGRNQTRKKKFRPPAKQKSNKQIKTYGDEDYGLDFILRWSLDQGGRINKEFHVSSFNYNRFTIMQTNAR
ncbi:unnamed protein product, partial [Linum tenue]